MRLKLMAQGMVQHADVQSQVWYHSAIQAPYNKYYLVMPKCVRRRRRRRRKINAPICAPKNLRLNIEPI